MRQSSLVTWQLSLSLSVLSNFYTTRSLSSPPQKSFLLMLSKTHPTRAKSFPLLPPKFCTTLSIHSTIKIRCLLYLKGCSFQTPFQISKSVSSISFQDSLVMWTNVLDNIQCQMILVNCDRRAILSTPFHGVLLIKHSRKGDFCEELLRNSNLRELACLCIPCSMRAIHQQNISWF